ncbi:beta-1,4-galactosyltransferase 4-like [Lineus longissimus]|uniref:beta-1,4-galactosyltransferase 4-like n=1 Tax=Lineus longissimus TaxID=88925 RepID=UPI002B4CFF1F
MTLVRVTRSRMNTWKRVWVTLVVIGYVLLWCVALFNHRPRAVYTLPDPAVITNTLGHDSQKEYCRVDLNSLTSQNIDILEDPEYDDIVKSNPQVQKGGHWAPKTCLPFQKVAIIIPYRNRWHHLKLLLKRLHPMLERQHIDYRIFVIEQSGTNSFNRGMLMNIGYAEAFPYGSFNCFIFQDADLLPEHDRNLYLCDNEARHLASAIDETRYHVMYYSYAGGVIAVNKENYIKMNGFSNNYWGWGQEDDDFSARAEAAGIKLTRPPEYIGRYKMVRHSKASKSDSGNNYLFYWRARWKTDGISSIKSVGYKVLSVSEEPLHTKILVDVGDPPNQEDVMESVKNQKPESLLWYLKFYFP